MVVRIDRNTIRKNPRAGSRSTTVFGNQRISFSVEGGIPDFLRKNPLVEIMTEWDNGCDGLFINDTPIKELIELKEPYKWKYDVEKDTQTFYHEPLAEYIYEYENPLIECGNCKQLIAVDDIEYDIDDDGNSLQECPKCNSYWTFDVLEYEKIEDVLKEQNKL